MKNEIIRKTTVILISYFLIRSVIQYVFMIKLPENVGVAIIFPNILANIMDVAIAIVLWRFGREYFRHKRINLRACGEFALTEAMIFAILFVYVKSGLEFIWTNDVAGAAFNAAYPLLSLIGVYPNAGYDISINSELSQMNATWYICFPFSENDLIEVMLIVFYIFLIRLISEIIGWISGKMIIKNS